MSDQISILNRLLQQTAARQGVLASNIANVDTPGYRAKDVKFEQALQHEIGLAATSPGHIASSGRPSSTSSAIEAVDTQPWIDQNNVELDQEVAKMTENAMLYQAGVTLLSTKIRMFKSALNTRG
jgi:flagellar basal-body rod protein FlgB